MGKKQKKQHPATPTEQPVEEYIPSAPEQTPAAPDPAPADKSIPSVPEQTPAAAEDTSADKQTPSAPKPKNSIAERVLIVISIVLLCIFVPVIVFNTILIVKGLTDPDHVPMVFGYGFVSAHAESMSPTFDNGDLIVLRACDPKELVPEDIISFYTDSVDNKTALVTRRVAALVTNDDGSLSFRTRADETEQIDSFFVPEAHVAGRYVTSVPRLGSYMEFLTQPRGVLLFGVLPLCLLFLADSLLFSRKKPEKEAPPKKKKAK